MVYDAYQHEPREYNAVDRELAISFTKILKEELKELLLEVIFFGSAARTPSKSMYGSDIDVLVIIDDRIRNLSAEAIEVYRILARKAAEQTSRRLHINTLKLSGFFEYITNGDPIAINILRDGVPLLETHFVKTLQKLLQTNQIKPTKEGIWSYFLRAPQTIIRAKLHILQATTDLYWAAIDATHSILQKMGKTPLSPEDALYLVTTVLIPKQHIDKKTANILHELYTIEKRIANRDLKDIKGKDYQNLYNKTKQYISCLNKISANIRFKAEI